MELRSPRCLASISWRCSENAINGWKPWPPFEMPFKLALG